ncbi:MAG: phosphotransferase family protein [Pyrinomonadaceae bacterium]
MTASKDSVAVRRGEDLDVAALDRYLRDRLSTGTDAVAPNSKLEVEQFPGGHSNLTYLVRYGTDEFVLRRPPVGPVAPTAHDIPREYKLLSLINPQFNLAPRPVLLCEDISIIGTTFYLMERRRGHILRSQLPDNISHDLGLLKRISETVIDTLVSLHEVDIYSCGIASIGKPDGFVERQVRGWASRWHRSKTNELAEMDQVIKWLVDRIPSDSNRHATIVHNDFKLDNLIFDDHDTSRLVAVLDWEMCTVGDPLVDLGLFLTYWTMSGGDADHEKNSSLRALTNAPGWMTREEIIERYQTATGRDLARIAFYETFARFKIAVVVQQIYFRYVKGQTHDERFRNFDVLVRRLIRESLEMAQRSGI